MNNFQWDYKATVHSVCDDMETLTSKLHNEIKESSKPIELISEFIQKIDACLAKIIEASNELQQKDKVLKSRKNKKK